MLGCTQEDLGSVEKWDQIVHQDDRDWSAKRYARLLDGKLDNDEWEQRFVRGDGLTVSADGNFSIIREIRRKRAIRAQHEQRHHGP